MSAAEVTLASTSVTIHVNDKPRTFTGPTMLLALVHELGLAERKGVAVAVNNSVVPRAAWAAHALAEGDSVLVIRATQGG